MTALTPKKGPHVATDWRETFLRSLTKYANVSYAARTAKVSRQLAYQTKQSEPAFAAAWDDAIEQACDSLEKEAWRRATQGVKREKGVYYKNEQIATEVTTDYSDTLLIVLLKAHRPEKYRETTRNVNVNLTPEQASQLSDEELAAKLKERGLA